MPDYNLGNLLDAAADVNFLHPDDKYDAVIVRSAYKLSGKGNHMVVADFKVTTGPYRDKPVTIRNNFVLSPDNARALDMLFQQLSNLGIPQTWFAQRRQLGGQELMEQLAPVLMNRVAQITTKQGEFNGRKKVDVTWVNPPTEAGKRAAGKPTTPSTPQTASPAPETASKPEPVSTSTPAPAEAQEAVQSDAADPTPETSSGGETGEHPDVTAAKAAQDAGPGPELPF